MGIEKSQGNDNRSLAERVQSLEKLVKQHLGAQLGIPTSQIPHKFNASGILPFTILGDTVYYDGSVAQRLGITNNRIYYSLAGVPIWATPSAVLDDILTTNGDILYNNSGTISRLGITNNRILYSSGSAPVWTTVSGVLDDILTTSGDTFYNNSGTVTRLAKGPPMSLYFMDASGNFPTWANTQSTVGAAYFDNTNFTLGVVADNHHGIVTLGVDNGSSDAGAYGAGLVFNSDVVTAAFYAYGSAATGTTFGVNNAATTFLNQANYPMYLGTRTSHTVGIATNDVVRLTVSGSGVVNISNLTASKYVVTNSSKDLVSQTGVPGSDLTGDHDNSVHTNRTRRIPLVPIYDINVPGYPVFAQDAHGSLPTGVAAHIDQADADATYVRLIFAPVVVPSDFVSGMTLNFIWSSNAASNNCVFGYFAQDSADTLTAPSTMLNNGAVAIAAPAVANTQKLSSVAFSPDATAGRVIHVRLDLNSNDAGDTNTGTRTFWGAYLTYTADM